MRTRAFVLFLLLAATPWAPAQPFTLSASSIVSPGFYSRVIGDFDGNGMADIVQTAYSQVGIFLNPGTSNLPTTPPPALHGSNALTFRVGDFNGDGHLDFPLFGSTGTNANFQVMLGDGLGGLAPPVVAVTHPTPSGPAVSSIGDLNGDGRDDVCFARTVSSTTTVSVWLSTWSPTPAGSWTQALSFAGAGTVRTASADVNGDAYDDLVSWRLSPSPSSIDVRFGGPSGPVATATTVSLGMSTSIKAFGDLNSDGAVDMVVNTVGGYAVRFGHPTNVFASSVTIPTPPVFTGSVQVADSDGDGNQDIFLARVVGGSPRVHYLVRGDGAGGFGALEIAATTTAPFAFHRGDLDGDGDLDMFTFDGCPSSTAVQVWRNDAIYGEGCPGTNGVPTFDIGAPIPGNSSFALSVGSALPGATAVLGLSLARTALPPCAGVQIDLSQLLIDPASLTTTTDAQGTASFPIPLPNEPALVGATVYAQWGVVDPAGSLATSFANLAVSPARAIKFF